MKVLYIGNDSRTLEIATLALRLRWPSVVIADASTAAEGLEQLAAEIPDITLLRPDVVDMRLSQVLDEVRRFTNVPLIVFGTEDTDIEAITALEKGADDYIRLPRPLTELVARIWALIRRSGSRTTALEESPMGSGSLFINPGTYEAFLGNQHIKLTTTEFKLLHLLLKNRSTVVTHETFGRFIWGDEAVTSDLSKKYVQRLRRKLGDDAQNPSWIASVRGVGYRFVGPPDTRSH